MNRKAIVSFFLIFTFILLARIATHFALSHSYKAGETVDKKITVFSDPKTSGRFQRVNFTLESGQSILLTIPSSVDFSYGDTIRVRGELKSRRIGEKNVLVLDYPQIIVKKSTENPILAILAKVRQDVAGFYSQNLPQTSSSLLMGIVFGIKENMPKSFSDLLKTTGVTHVVAASGMNVTIIAGFFSLSFGRIFRRRVALILTLAAIAFYAILSGLSPSIVRAGIMGTIVFSSQILGRQNTSLIALFLTSFAMLFITPALILDIGFQLSVFSTLGILIINPILEAKFRTKNIVKILGDTFITTVSAQIMTIPIILSNFGSYSPLSIIVNLLVLWTVAPLMVLGALAALLAFVFKPLAVLVLYLSYPFLFYFEEAVKAFGNLDTAISLKYLPWQVSVGYYFLLSAILIKIKR